MHYLKKRMTSNETILFCFICVCRLRRRKHRRLHCFCRRHYNRRLRSILRWNGHRRYRCWSRCYGYLRRKNCWTFWSNSSIGLHR